MATEHIAHIFMDLLGQYFILAAKELPLFLNGGETLSSVCFAHVL